MKINKERAQRLEDLRVQAFSSVGIFILEFLLPELAETENARKQREWQYAVNKIEMSR